MNSLALFREKKRIAKLKKEVPENHSIKALCKALYSSVKKNAVGVSECAVLFSGGIDSSIIAFALKDFVESIELFCTGLPNSKSLLRARKNAELLELNLNEVIIQKRKVFELVKKTSEAIDSKNWLQLNIALPGFTSMQAIKNASLKTVFSGTGADELFCGYSEFKGTLKEKGFDGVEELIWKKLTGMFERNLKRELSLAKNFSLDLRIPFLEKGFILQAMAFPPQKKIFSPKDELRKHALRELAQKIGLPEKICFEKKKAIQYDAGISGELKKVFRDNFSEKKSL